ncbi:MAG: sigma-70 family RNA polymerase sigma factor, partial [Bacteroidia bacterium]|nr:sigma-70 family RNA polymerase sigma factor [Bacteroidia bacterium]
ALNTAIAHLNRSKRTIQKVSVNFELLDMVDENDRIMDERTRLLYEHIKRLNVIEKGLILLFLEGNSYDEISNITGFSVTNVGTRLQRIKEKLRTTIKL